MKKICLIISTLYGVEVFLLDQLSALTKLYDVYVITNTAEVNFLERHGIKAKLISAPIERKIHPIRDFLALFQIFKLFKDKKFDLVHSVTPKAGLLAMIAAAFARVPIRVHTFTGQVWGTRSGVMCLLLKTADKITAWLATHLLVDSFSQRVFLLQNKVITENKSFVLAKGSISGVNISRFKPDPKLRLKIRRDTRSPKRLRYSCIWLG